ncbi:transposase [Myceligenerans halotolerans]
MPELVLRPAPLTAPEYPIAGPTPQEVILGELGPTLFASLTRNDQRRKAMQYVHALLVTRGRKSIRSISRAIGGSAAAQRLHHFVSSSPWDWQPVRRATAHHLVRTMPPRAWVVHRSVFPKAGTSSVGVERTFEPAEGRTLNAQRAVDVWAVSSAGCSPVDWQLRLPKTWLDDVGYRRSAQIPDTVRERSLVDIIVSTCASMTDDWGLPRRPVVMDARDVDVADVVSQLRTHRLPFLFRVDRSLRLVPADAASGTGPARARRILEANGRMRRPVMPVTSGLPVFAATVPVHLAADAGRVRGSEPLALVGLGGLAEPWPAGAWLTNVTTAPPAALHDLTRLLDQVERAFVSACATAGLRDFAGRSYGGWHRHLTLASAAHAIDALARLETAAV